jgi:hypothetical protein
MPASVPCNVCGVEYARAAEHWHRQPKRSDRLSETCKPCAIARARAHYAANKERHAENRKEYRRLHPEVRRREHERLKQQRRAENPIRYIERTTEARAAAALERRKQYYESNRERLIAASGERRKKDPEKTRAERHRFYEANKEQIAAKAKEWAKGWRKNYFALEGAMV